MEETYLTNLSWFLILLSGRMGTSLDHHVPNSWTNRNTIPTTLCCAGVCLCCGNIKFNSRIRFHGQVQALSVPNLTFSCVRNQCKRRANTDFFPGKMNKSQKRQKKERLALLLEPTIIGSTTASRSSCLIAETEKEWRNVGLNHATIASQ